MSILETCGMPQMMEQKNTGNYWALQKWLIDLKQNKYTECHLNCFLFPAMGTNSMEGLLVNKVLKVSRVTELCCLAVRGKIVYLLTAWFSLLHCFGQLSGLTLWSALPPPSSVLKHVGLLSRKESTDQSLHRLLSSFLVVSVSRAARRRVDETGETEALVNMLGSSTECTPPVSPKLSTNPVYWMMSQMLLLLTLSLCYCSFAAWYTVDKGVTTTEEK